MTTKTKKIAYTTLACLGLIGMLLVYGSLINQAYQGRAWSIGRLICKFIKENNGSLPQNQQELIDKRYIKVEYMNGVPKYFTQIKSGNETEWDEWPVHLEKFTIRYNAKNAEFVIIDNMLCEKDSRQEIFLLDGPYNRKMEPTLRRTYRLISLEWYKLMKNKDE